MNIRRIFNFFDRTIGVKTFGEIVDMALEDYKGCSIDEAVTNFYLNSQAAQILKDDKDTAEYYSNPANQAELESLSLLQSNPRHKRLQDILVVARNLRGAEESDELIDAMVRLNLQDEALEMLDSHLDSLNHYQLLILLMGIYQMCSEYTDQMRLVRLFDFIPNGHPSIQREFLNLLEELIEDCGLRDCLASKLMRCSGGPKATKIEEVKQLYRESRSSLYEQERER